MASVARVAAATPAGRRVEGGFGHAASLPCARKVRRRRGAGWPQGCKLQRGAGVAAAQGRRGTPWGLVAVERAGAQARGVQARGTQGGQGTGGGRRGRLGSRQGGGMRAGRSGRDAVAPRHRGRAEGNSAPNVRGALCQVTNDLGQVIWGGPLTAGRLRRRAQGSGDRWGARPVVARGGRGGKGGRRGAGRRRHCREGAPGRVWGPGGGGRARADDEQGAGAGHAVGGRVGAGEVHDWRCPRAGAQSGTSRVQVPNRAPAAAQQKDLEPGRAGRSARGAPGEWPGSLLLQGGGRAAGAQGVSTAGNRLV